MFITTYSISKITYSILIWTSIFSSIQCFFLSNLFQNSKNEQPITLKVPEDQVIDVEKMFKNNPELFKTLVFQHQNDHVINGNIPMDQLTQQAYRNQMANNNYGISNFPPVSNFRNVQTSSGNLPNEVMINNKKYIVTTRAGILRDKMVNLFKMGTSAIISPFKPSIEYSIMPISDNPKIIPQRENNMGIYENEEQEMEKEEEQKKKMINKVNDKNKQKVKESKKSETIQNKKTNIQNDERDENNRGKPEKIVNNSYEDDYDLDDDNDLYFY